MVTESNNNSIKHQENAPKQRCLSDGIERLKTRGEIKHFDKDHVLVKSGDIPKYCYIIENGRVIAYGFTFNGDERIHTIIDANSLFLEASLILKVGPTVNFKTTVASDLICISREVLIKAMKDDPPLAYEIAEYVSRKYLNTMEQLRQANSHSATWNICNKLLQLTNRYAVLYDGKMLIKEKISQQMLSSLVGINRITTVRIIKKLKDMKLIEQINGYYCIPDIEKYKNYLQVVEDTL